MNINRREFFKLSALAGFTALLPWKAMAQKPKIPTVDMQLESTPIVAKTRTLNAGYTPEFAQDLRYYHGLDAEKELYYMLQQELEHELGRNAKGTLTRNKIMIHPETFMQYYTFTFTEDGKNSYENMWGLKL